MKYELRKKHKSMPTKDAITFLEKAQVGRLAMSLENQPYIIPLNYVFYNEKIYFHCAKEGKKIDYFTKNPNICFEVDEQLSIKRSEKACDFGTRYRSVIVYGKIRLLEDSKKKIEVMTKLMEKYSGSKEYPPIPESSLQDTNIAEIAIKKIYGKQDLG